MIKHEPGWDANARTIATMVADGYYTFKVGPCTGIGIGLAKESCGGDPRKLPIGFLATTCLTNSIYPSEYPGYYIISFGEIVVGPFERNLDSVFKIERNRGIVRLYCDNALIYTTHDYSIPTFGGTCWLEAAFYSIHDAVTWVFYTDLNNEPLRATLELPPLVGIGGLDEIIGSGRLPLLSSSGDSDYASGSAQFPPVLGYGSEVDVSFGDGSLRLLKSTGRESSWIVIPVNIGDGDLPRLHGSGSDDPYEVINADNDLPYLWGFGHEQEELNIGRNGRLQPLHSYSHMAYETDNTFLIVVSNAIRGPGWPGASLELPAFEIDFDAYQDLTERDSDQIIPSLICEATGGSITIGSFPGLLLSASVTTPGWVNSTLEIPAFEIECSGWQASLIEASLEIPAFQVSSKGGSVTAATLAAMECSASVLMGSQLEATLELEALVLSSEGFIPLAMTVDVMLPALETWESVFSVQATIPALELEATASHLVSASTCYIVNVSTGAVTQALNYNFDRMITTGKDTYGLKGDKLYRLAGNTDGTAAISFKIRTCQDALGSHGMKKMGEVYLYGRSLAALTIKGIYDERNQMTYSTPPDLQQGIGEHKVHTGKGLSFNTVALEITGGDIALADIDFNPTPLTRKIKTGR